MVSQDTYRERRQQLLDDYVRISVSRGGALDGTVLRTRSLTGRQVIAHQASGGRMDLESLLEAARAGSTPSGLDPAVVGRLGRVLALSDLSHSDLDDAILLFELAQRVAPDHALEEDVLYPLIQSLFDAGRLNAVRAWLETPFLSDQAAPQLRVDLGNPTINPNGDIAAWLTGVGTIMGLGEHGLSPLSLRHEGSTLFDRLTGEPGRAVNGPLVTVIVTAYRPGTELLTAVASLVNQSWQDLEILVIDDGSGEEYNGVLEEAEGQDGRVRVLRLPENGGTYRARNAALAASNGELVTFHDSDDWAHPERIAVEAGRLLAEPDLVAAKGGCLRVSEDVIMNKRGYYPVRVAASSLMFHRRKVMSRIGFMDSVRKGADTEYELRIRASFSDQVQEHATPALTVVRFTTNSLSRQDFRRGWRHPSRWAYRSAYEEWHRAIRRDEASPFLPLSPDRRPFAAPRRFLPGTSHRTHYDAVFVGVWTEEGGPQRSMLAEIAALREAGARVAISHLSALRFMSRRHQLLAPAVQRLVNERAADDVQLDNRISVDLVVVRYPPVLQFPPSEPQCRWDVGQVWIVANQTPAESDGTDRRYIVEDCDTNAKSLFGVKPTWVPQGPAVRLALESELGDSSDITLAGFESPGIIDADHWRADREALHKPIRIGRHSRDNPIKFPSSVEIMKQAYPSNPDFEVHVMGGEATLALLFGDHPTPGNWKVLPYGFMPVRDFLSGLDFFVYFDNADSSEAFGRSILEALASGVVVILNKKHQQTFGEAALYCEPWEVENLVRVLAADADSRREQIERAHAIVRERFSPETFRNLAGPHLPNLRAHATASG